MPWQKPLTVSLVLTVLLSVAPSCAVQAKIFQNYPSAVDLTAEAKPKPPVDILTSEVAADKYEIGLETWGERGWQAVGRICKWAKALGMEDAPC